MRRDLDLVRQLLIEVADGETHKELHSEVSALKNPQLSKELIANDLAIEYHLDIMKEANLVHFKKNSYMDGTISFDELKLTWAGQDYLSNIENDTVWRNAKSIAKEKGLELTKMSLSLAVELAIQEGKRLLGI